VPVPYKLERRRIETGRPCELALVHPATGAELGRIVAADEGYRVRMPDPNTGRCSVLLPETFPTVHAARETILEAHEPEPE
jgi:hypothetical protein